MDNGIAYGTVKTDSFEMDYASFGRGTYPFIVIPGISLLPTTPSAPQLSEMLEKYADSYRVYLFDRIKLIPEGYSIEDMANDQVEAMRTLGLLKADFFGASQGGMIALIIAAEYPDMVGKIAVSSSTVRLNDESKNVFSEFIKLSREGDVCKLNRAIFCNIYSEEYRRKYKEAFEQAEKAGTPEQLKHFIGITNPLISFDMSDKMQRIKCPVMTLSSKNDKVFPWESAKEIAELTNGRYYIYDKYSHAVYDEAPEFYESLFDYFKS